VSIFTIGKTFWYYKVAIKPLLVYIKLFVQCMFVSADTDYRYQQPMTGGANRGTSSSIP